jgi:methyl-accepting chemotaxis protein
MKVSFKSLKMSILLIVFVAVVIAIAVLNVISVFSGKGAVNKAYLNQLHNIITSFNKNLENYCIQQERMAKFLASDPTVIEAATTNNHDTARKSLRVLFKELGNLENVFISTAEKDTQIFIAGYPDSEGLRWRDKGFNDNIDKALEGKIHTSSPYKSPVTQKVVILVTVPIFSGNQVKAILGLPFDVETFSNEYIKNMIIGKTGYAFVTDKKGMTIAHPEAEVIYKLSLSDMDWGQKALESPDYTVIYYDWKGDEKVLTGVRSKKYDFITFSTIFSQDIQEDVDVMAQRMILVGFLAVILSLFFIYWFINRRFKPLNEAIDRARDLAEGEADLTKRITVTVEDEIGEMAGYFNKFIERINEIMKKVKMQTENISSSSAEFTTVAGQMAEYSNEVTAQATNVASATEEVTASIANIASASEEMSVNISTVSSTAEQMSQNMVTVAGSTEEMSASINQIAENAMDASKIADNAVKLASESTSTMNTLGTAAEEIGKVTEVIKRIADKTNLLALNATIEAASAGDAGKGFAVVANEIKELANQSAKAAEDIANRIQGVQANTVDAVKVIENVAEIIKTINEAVVSITNSVQQQSVAANDISANVLQAKTGVNSIANAVTELSKAAGDMSLNAGEASKGANEVGINITEVNKGAIQNNNSAQQVNRSSEDLAKISQHLLEVVNRFKMNS